MSSNLSPAPAAAALIAPVTVTIPATPAPRILRPAIRHARPLNLQTLLRPVLKTLPPMRVSDSVMAAAFEWARQQSATPPRRWLQKLARVLQPDFDRVKAADGCFEALPKAVWNESTVLGEWLLVARELATQTRRGRAGRESIGCVYTPAEVAREIVAEVHVGARRVVDPACGAGVFLLEAFQRAFERRVEGGSSRLDAAKAALSHELTGVDVDADALAVAEFSLRMAAFRASGLNRDVAIDLRHANALQPLFDLDGRCDCVVGNPPFIEGRGLSAAALSFLRGNFRCAAKGKVNLFAAFIERGLGLLKQGGVLAFIVPATFRRNSRYLGLRQILLQHTLEAIKPIEAESFGERVVETVLLRVRKQPPTPSSRVQLASGKTLQTRLPLGPVLRFTDNLPRGLRRQIEVMERHGVPLGDCFNVRDGISTGFHPFPQRLLGTVAGKHFVAQDGTRRRFNPDVHRKIIDGGEFRSFSPIEWAGRYIEYDKDHEHTPPHPGKPFNCQLRDREIFDRAEKLLTRQTARGIIATLDCERYFVRNSVHATYARPHPTLTLSLAALCACLNSRLYTDYLLAVTGENGVVFPQVHIADLRRLPLLPGLLRADGKLAVLGAELLALHRRQNLPAGEIAAAQSEVAAILTDAFGFPL